MDLCSEGHDEVCFEGSLCPACEKISELSDEMDELNMEINELEEKIKWMEG